MVNKETNLSKTLTCIINTKSKFGLCHTSFRDLWWFLVGLWGAKILKSEQDFKNIQKFPKHNLTKKFDIYSKGHKWIQSMPHLFKGPILIFLDGFWGANILKK